MSTSAQTLQGPFGWAKLHGEKYVGQVLRHGRADRPSAHAEKLPYDAIFSGVHLFRDHGNGTVDHHLKTSGASALYAAHPTRHCSGDRLWRDHSPG